MCKILLDFFFCYLPSKIKFKNLLSWHIRNTFFCVLDCLKGLIISISTVWSIPLFSSQAEREKCCDRTIYFETLWHFYLTEEKSKEALYICRALLPGWATYEQLPQDSVGLVKQVE